MIAKWKSGPGLGRQRVLIQETSKNRIPGMDERVQDKDEA